MPEFDADCLIVNDHPEFPRFGRAQSSSSGRVHLIVGRRRRERVRWAAIEELLPDLVLLDIQLSGMSGFDRLRRISSVELSNRTPGRAGLDPRLVRLRFR